MNGYYVYVYTDPRSGVVRYVGSGQRRRMCEHTKPCQIDNPNNESPFYRWLRKNRDVEWVRHRERVTGPLTKEFAEHYEQWLIEHYFDTTLNTRAANNGREMKPSLRPPREPYGVRSDSGREKVLRNFRKNKFGGNVMAGRGISKDGDGWRVRVRVGDKLVRKMFRTYCEALRFRKSLE